jgi:hypothetical protein
MPRIPSPLHDKTVPKRVSKPTVTAEAAATVAESAVVAPPAARKARAAKPAAARKTQQAAAVAVPRKAVGKKTKAAPAAKSRAEAAPAVAPAPAKPAKAHKPKLVRDSFTIPKDEYAVLEALKSRALALGQHVRKSELLRAGIQALGTMNDGAFLKAVGAVPTLKTGRPRKG